MPATAKPKTRQRYGFLKMKCYNPSTHVLIRPQIVTLEFPWCTNLDYVRDQVFAAAGDMPVSWLVKPYAYEWHCGCTGDALSGLVPCSMHMDVDSLDEPGDAVMGYGVWLPVARELLPDNAKPHKSYPVPCNLLPQGHPALVSV